MRPCRSGRIENSTLGVSKLEAPREAAARGLKLLWIRPRAQKN